MQISNNVVLLGHPIRDGMAELSASIFEFCLNPLLKIPNIIASVMGSETDPMYGVGIGSMKAGIDTVAMKIGNALEGIGVSLCVLFFLIALIELAMTERMTLEYFIKFFSKLAVGLYAVLNWDGIYSGLKQFGSALATLIATEGGVVDVHSDFELSDKFSQMAESAGAAIWLVMILAALFIGAILALATIAILAVTYIICFTWVLEVGIRGAFLPIACALLSDDGWRGAGGRYLRRFAAVCAQGAVMTGIGHMGGSALAIVVGNLIAVDNVTGTTLKEFIGYMFDIGLNIVIVIGLCFAIVSVMFKASSIVMDVFGG